MKYLLTLILISCLTVVNAQDVFKFNAVASKYADRNQSWAEVEWVDNDIFLSAVIEEDKQTGKIKIYSKRPQAYDLLYLRDTGDDTDGSWVVWYAEDEKGINCNIKLKLWGDEEYYDQLTVFYSNKKWCYALEAN